MGLVDLLKNSVALATNQQPDLPLPGAWTEGPDDLVGDEGEDFPPQPEIVVTKEWGLRLPGGHIAWNRFQGVTFDNPMDRVHMIARLQQTAQDVGFDVEDFLGRYGWATRNQVAAVIYEDLAQYSLADNEVTQPNEGEQS